MVQKIKSCPSDSHSFVLGIPTKDRPKELQNSLKAISQLKYLPALIVVCDSSSDDNHRLNAQICRTAIVPTFIIRSEKASIPFQRNRIVEFALSSQECFDYLLFLDDDTQPHPYYSQLLIDFLSINCEYGGACGVTQSKERSKIADWFGLMFLVSGNPGRVSLSGTGIPPNRSLIKGSDTRWIFGCSMWRRQVLVDFKWDESWEGYAVGEDVYFSFRVSKNWKLRVLPTAQIINDEVDQGRPTFFRLARMSVTNRWKIAQLHNQTKILLFICVVWSVIGEIGFRFFKAILKCDFNEAKAIAGYTVGLFDILTQKELTS